MAVIKIPLVFRNAKDLYKPPFASSVNREATSTVDFVVRPFVRTSRFNNVPPERLFLPGIYIFTYYARIRYIYHGSFSSLLILEVKFAGRLKTTLGRRIFGRTPQCFRRGFRPGCKILYSSRSFSYFCFLETGFVFVFLYMRTYFWT